MSDKALCTLFDDFWSCEGLNKDHVGNLIN